MLSTITSFFESHFASSQEEDSTKHTEHQLQLASAALMIELCKSDQSIDDSETNTLVGILRNRFQLDPGELDELMALADQEVREATSLYQFTSLMNDNFDYGEKVMLVTNLWEVAFADGKIDRYEEHMIRKVADLLYLSHSDFISAKLKAREITQGPVD